MKADYNPNQPEGTSASRTDSEIGGAVPITPQSQKINLQNDPNSQMMLRKLENIFSREIKLTGSEERKYLVRHINRISQLLNEDFIGFSPQQFMAAIGLTESERSMGTSSTPMNGKKEEKTKNHKLNY